MLPPLPNSVKIFEYLHLSPSDQQFVKEFCVMLVDPIPRADIEQVFDILCIDFGSQIFLQKSQILRAILHGLRRESEYHYHQSLNFLHQLVCSWTQSFRQAIDNQQPHLINVFNDTPNNSNYWAANLGYQDSECEPEDSPISLPFACWEIFKLVVPLLRNIDSFHIVLEIIYEIIPYVRIYINACVDMDNQSDDGQSTLLMMVDQCLTAVREVIRFCDLAVEQFEDKVQRNDMFVSENGGSIADLTADRAKAMLVKLGFDLIYKFLSIEMDGEEKSVIWLVFRNFLQGLESTSVPRTICEEIINEVKSSNIYLFLLSNKSKVLRQTAYSCLLNDIRLRATTGAQGNGLLEREELLNEIITYGLNDTFSEIQAIAKDIIITFITEFTQASILRPYIPLLQIFLSDDAPQFVQILIDKCPDISAFEILTYRIRGLFQKKEIVRKVVSHQLLQTLRLRETSMEICDAPHEAFVFSASFVDSLNVEKDVALMTISGLHGEDLEQDLQRLAKTLQTSDELDSLKTALKSLNILVQGYPTSRLTSDLRLVRSVVELITKPSVIDEECLLYLFRILRIFAEFDVQAREDLQLRHSFISEAAKHIFHTDPKIRYELSKLYFAILFGVGIFQPRLSQPPRSFKAAESEHFISPDYDSASMNRMQNRSQINMLVYVLDSLNVYNENVGIESNWTTNISMEDREIRWILKYCKDYRMSRGSEAGSNYGYSVSQVVESLKSIKSHSEFYRALQVLRLGCISVDDYFEFGVTAAEESIKRFLLVPPATEQDATLLIQFLSFLSKILRRRICSHRFMKMLHDAVASNIANFIAWNIDAEIGDIQVTLNNEILRFLRWYLTVCNEFDIQQLASSSNIIETLQQFGDYALINGVFDNHRLVFNLLRSIVAFTSIPNLLDCAPFQIAFNLIRFLVSIIGHHQQNSRNRGSEDNFTYRGRSIYREAALALRNMSRCILSKRIMDKDQLWGSHWLYNNELSWLSHMLSDDEKYIQEQGLGILSNLLMMRDSYPHVTKQYPRLLDMAFSFAMDLDRSDSLRKESILIINNFLVTFCEDNRIYSPEVMTEPNSDIDDGTTGHPRTFESKPIADLLAIFDELGFFDRIKDFLLSSLHSPLYGLALYQLLLNLSVAAPGYVFGKLYENGALSTLVECLDVEEVREMLNEPFVLTCIRRQQFKRLYDDVMEMKSFYTLKMISILLAQNSALPEILITNTNILSKLKKIFVCFTERHDVYDVGLNSVLSEFRQLTPIPYPLIAVSMKLFGDVLLQIFQLESSAVISFFETESFRVSFLAMLYTSINQRVNFSAHQTAVYLLDKILHLHYGEDFPIGIDGALSVKHALDDVDGEKTLASLLTTELINILLIDRNESSSVYQDSCVGSLRCLLGCNEIAKRTALSLAFSEKLVERLLKKLHTGIKFDAKSVHYFSSMLSLLLHFFAGVIETKVKSSGSQLHILLYRIFTAKDIPESVILTSLLVLRNFINNCDQNKRIIVEPIKFKKSTRSPAPIAVPEDRQRSLLTCLSKMMKQYSKSETMLLYIFEILKVLTLFNESRIAMYKIGIVQDVLEMLGRQIRSRDSKKTEMSLVLMYLFSFTNEGMGMNKYLGLQPILIDAMGNKSHRIKYYALCTLRNLMFAKEGKVHILADENFLPNTIKIIKNAKSIQLLYAAMTLLWVLLWNSNQTKVACKKAMLLDEIIALQGRLNEDEFLNAEFLGPDSEKVDILGVVEKEIGLEDVTNVISKLQLLLEN